MAIKWQIKKSFVGGSPYLYDLLYFDYHNLCLIQIKQNITLIVHHIDTKIHQTL